MTIEDIVAGVYPACALLAGMQLDVFTPLGSGPKGAAELAGVLGVEAERLEAVLCALVAAGLLERVDGRYANGAEADRRLVRGRAEFIGARHLLWSHCFAGALQAGESVRRGAPAARIDFAEQGTDAEALLRGLHPGAKAVGAELARQLDLPPGAAVLDVGGGSAGVALGMLAARPSIVATVTELASVAPLTRAFITAEGAEARIQVIECDLCAQQPPGQYDVAVLKAFVQVLAPAAARRALAHVHRALRPGGRVAVYGDMVGDNGVEPPQQALFGLFFLGAYDSGRIYTEGEYRAWLAQAGFADIDKLEEGVLVAYKEV